MQFKEGSLVRFSFNMKRDNIKVFSNRHWYPPDNTIGIITEVHPGTCKVHWPHNTVDAPYEWYAPQYLLHPVTSFKTRFIYWLFKIIRR